MCKDCPFKVENILKFKSNIYEEIKEKSKGRTHRCHKRNGSLCNGYINEAKEKLDRPVLVQAFEEVDFQKGGKIKQLIREVDIELGNIKQ